MRIEQQSLVKKYPVLVAGFVVGSVRAKTGAEAQVLAQETFGPQAQTRDPVEVNQPTEFLEDEIGNRTFQIGACYRADFIPVYKQEPVQRDGIVVGLREEIEGSVGSLVDQWFLHHPGIHIIHFGSTKDPMSGHVGFLVVYYTMIELPTVHTLDELSGEPHITEAQLREQRDFLVRLTTDLQSNEALFDYARALGVEWNPAKHPITERANCVQAVRRFHRWI